MIILEPSDDPNAPPSYAAGAGLTYSGHAVSGLVGRLCCGLSYGSMIMTPAGVWRTHSRAGNTKQNSTTRWVQWQILTCLRLNMS